MAVNYTLLRYQADNIPNFDGNPKLLQRFISSCENLLRAFQNARDVNDPINICLFDTILGKLTHRAAELIASRTELNTWQLIKDALIVTFADQRSIDCLIQDLITLKPQKNEPPLNFGMRIQDARSLLFAKLSATNEAEAVKVIKIQHYDNFALKTFINGLPYNMQLVVRLKEPDSLERAMSYVREEENFIYFKNQNSNFSQSANSLNQNKQIRPNIPFKNPYTQINKPTYQQSNIPIFSRPQYYNPNQTVAFGQFQNNFRPPFNQLHNNLRPPFPQQNNFKPNFGQFQHNIRPPMQNMNPNFRPNNQWNFRQINPTQKTNLSKLKNTHGEPMEVSSGNTILKTANKPKYAIEELFNQEISEVQSTDTFPQNINYEQQNFDQTPQIDYNEINTEKDTNNTYFDDLYNQQQIDPYNEYYTNYPYNNDQYVTDQYDFEQEQNFTLTRPPNNLR